VKTVIWTAYGPPDVLQVQDMDIPQPNDNKVLVKVAATNVFPGDCELRRFDIKFPWTIPVRLIYGLFKPKAGSVLGQEFSGEVVEVGKNVDRFKPGDHIFGAVEPMASGAYTEYLLTSGKYATIVPDTLSLEEAAVVTVGGLNALHFLRIAGIQEGGPRKKVLLNGAGGSIGTLAIQIAKVYGAEVTAVDATHKLEILLAIGADKVIDYTQVDFTCNGETYDVVIDLVGKCSLFRTVESVKPGGHLILANNPFSHALLRLWSGIFSTRKVRVALAGYDLSALETLRDLLASGRIKPVIERRYTLTEIVEAHRYVETGQRTGNVVITVDAALARGTTAN